MLYPKDFFRTLNQISILPLPFRNRHLQLTFPIQPLNKINNQLRGMFFMMHVHEKIQFFQAIFQPVFDAFYPIIASGKIRWMQAVSDKTDKCFWCGEDHRSNVSSAGSIGYD